MRSPISDYNACLGPIDKVVYYVEGIQHAIAALAISIIEVNRSSCLPTEQICLGDCLSSINLNITSSMSIYMTV